MSLSQRTLQSMLHLHVSNHYEHLRAALLTQIALPCANPLQAQQVIVPSAALQRDLTLKGAERHGIFANVQFGFLAQWLWRQIACFVPVSDDSPFAAPALTWRIFEALSDPALVQEHPRLQSWLVQADDVMRFEFAQRTAALFETYTTYRPQWLERWLQQQPAGLQDPSPAVRADEAWQAHLWRHIDARLQLPTHDPMADFLKALSTLSPAQAIEQGLAVSAHLFCLPAIAPVHLGLLQAIGRVSELHLYVLNPCEEFWFDLVDSRRLTWLKARNRHGGREAGHPLLTTWGQQTQSHLGLLFDQLGDHTTEHGHFEPPAGMSLLAQVQQSILTLQPLAPGTLTLTPSDHSIDIRSCHSLSRELEVLHDVLLGLLTSEAPGAAPLHPGDILVVTPDLDTAAPLIEAVFGTVAANRHIDWTITGRARSRTHAPARALLSLLALIDSRVTATDVFSLLQQDVVARRFGLDDAALQQLHTWLLNAGFHWAFNPQQLADLKLPAQAAHTLEDALDRLFLGYALPDTVDAPFVGRLPAAPIEGSASPHLGALWRFTQLLGELRAHCAVGLAPSQWGHCLNAALDTFIDARADQIDDLRELRISVQTLVAQMQTGGLSGTLRLPVLRAALQSLLEDPARGGVPGGRVTFASMSSLRNLPYRVVCAIGLNTDSFPSNRRPAEFDLLALDPRPGDRQSRMDDRNLFLDLLLSARQVLYLSHSGRSSRDNTTIPPSTLIDELLDAITRATVMHDPASDEASETSIAAAVPVGLDAARAALAIRNHLYLEHPLQPFSPRAFTPDQLGADPRLQSFNTELAQALSTRHAPVQAMASAGLAVRAPLSHAALHPSTAAAFFQHPLPAPAGTEREVSLEQLVRFFRQPCRYLLEHRLHVQHPHAEDALIDDEPFGLSADARQRLAHRLLPALLEGKQAADLMPLARAGTELPRGSVGDALLRSELDALGHFAQRVRSAAPPQRLPAHTIDLRLPVQGETWRLHAVLTELPANGPLHWRYAKLQGTDCLRSWITLLAASATPVPGMAAQSSFVARNGLLRLRAPEHPSAILSELLGVYRRGLTQPLPFFPYSSWACMSGKSENLSAARAMWEGHVGSTFAESDDPAYQLALRGLADPIGLEFLTLSRQVFGPLLEHVDERP